MDQWKYFLDYYINIKYENLTGQKKEIYFNNSLALITITR